MNNICDHQNESGNFCSQCGVALRERCPECGEMEEIGRKACCTKVKEAKGKKCAYVQERDPKYLKRGLFLVICYCSISLALEAAAAITRDDRFMYALIPWAIGLGAGIYVSSSLDDTKGNRRRKELELEFLQKFPEYAEILKQAEEEK